MACHSFVEHYEIQLYGGDFCAGKVDGMDYIGCSSPLHRLCFLNQYLIARPPRAEDCRCSLGLFLQRTIMQMSASRLRAALEDNTVGAPYNWQLQVEFLKAASSCRPSGANIAPYVGAVSLHSVLPFYTIFCIVVRFPYPYPHQACIRFVAVSCQGSLAQVGEAKGVGCIWA